MPSIQVFTLPCGAQFTMSPMINQCMDIRITNKPQSQATIAAIFRELAVALVGLGFGAQDVDKLNKHLIRQVEFSTPGHLIFENLTFGEVGVSRLEVVYYDVEFGAAPEDVKPLRTSTYSAIECAHRASGRCSECA